MGTRVVTAHIPSELTEQLDQLAVRIDRPKGWIIKQALASWVELEAKREPLTLEGLADVDAIASSITPQLMSELEASTRLFNSCHLNGRRERNRVRLHSFLESQTK